MVVAVVVVVVIVVMILVVVGNYPTKDIAKGRLRMDWRTRLVLADLATPVRGR